MKETKIKYKDSELSSTLRLNFGKYVNLARIKFIAMFLCALSKAQTVNYEKTAALFGGKADGASSHRRTQRFMER